MLWKNPPFLAEAVLGGCAAVVLTLEGAVVALGTVGFAAAELAKGLEAAVLGREVAEAGLDVEEPVVGLQRRTHIQATCQYFSVCNNSEHKTEQPGLFVCFTNFISSN